MSVASLLSLLDESDSTLQGHALAQLLPLVDTQWPQIAEKVVRIEELAELPGFAHSRMAATLASRCFFHLEEYDESTRLALQSGQNLLQGTDEFSAAIVGRCLDTYVANTSPSPELDRVVNDLFASCYASGRFAQALGMALESKRIGKVREVLARSGVDAGLLRYCLDGVFDHVTKGEFRRHVLELLVELHSQSASPAYLEWFTCLYLLDRVADFAALVTRLQSDGKAPLAMQAVFDLLELQDQRFEQALATALGKDHAVAADDKLASILVGGKKAAIYLDFLYKANKTDPVLLGWLKATTMEGRKNSVLHQAVVVAHGYMSAGTTSDGFLRNNLEWLGRASNWAKFGSTASLGVIHKGNVSQSLSLLRPYLPAPGAPGASPYSEGGALYALGLIHAGEGVAPADRKAALDHLLASLDEAVAVEVDNAREALQHGACLGIGLVGMSSSSVTLCERLRTVLYADSAVVGEAAALAIGLIMFGAGDEAQALVRDLVGYAHDTDHEKIKRAASMACALIYYGREDEAGNVVNQLVQDKDHLVRYGGVFCIGLAFVGTANNAALQRLLHVAVSDVSNDVRRAAVMCLGLVLLRVPGKVPGMIALLSESYNPHVRYGACMALAIGCASMADPSPALAVLEPLLEDKTDFVKHAAMMAAAILLAQRRPEADARAKRFRDAVYKAAADSKSASTMTRMGAILAAGIVDAGGRNVAVSLLGRGGKPKPPAVAGMVLWTLSWYWYPCLHMISLAMSPSVIAGANSALDLPVDFRLECAGGDTYRRFGPPDPVEEKKEETKSRIKTVALSMKGKPAAAASVAAAAPAAPVTPATPSTPATATAATAAAGKDDAIKTVPVSAPSDEAMLSNPVRVTKAMMEFVRVPAGQRYAPVSKEIGWGILVLDDSTPGEEEQVIKVAPPPPFEFDPNEPEPPAPFEWEPPSAAAAAASSSSTAAAAPSSSSSS